MSCCACLAQKSGLSPTILAISGDFAAPVIIRRISVVYVFVLIGRRSPTDAPYVVNIYGSRLAARIQRWRWLRRHPLGSAEIDRYTVFGDDEVDAAPDEETG